MNSKVEAFLKKTILPELERGRPQFDRPHTIAVVEKIKEILKHNSELKLDEDVLTIAGYAHDWGYSDLFEGGKIADYEDIKRVKPKHMEIGAQKIQVLLQNPVFDYLTQEQKNRIVHLVRIHDKLDDLQDDDELVLMEADTLGGMDIDKVKPTFSPKSNEAWMKSVLKKRVSLFITEYSRNQAEILIEKRKQHYANLK